MLYMYRFFMNHGFSTTVFTFLCDCLLVNDWYLVRGCKKFNWMKILHPFCSKKLGKKEEQDAKNSNFLVNSQHVLISSVHGMSEEYMHFHYAGICIMSKEFSWRSRFLMQSFTSVLVLSAIVCQSEYQQHFQSYSHTPARDDSDYLVWVIGQFAGSSEVSEMKGLVCRREPTEALDWMSMSHSPWHAIPDDLEPLQTQGSNFQLLSEWMKVVVMSEQCHGS